ncbi:class II fructose-1,6-bisphosphate aldolase [Mycoplasma sp. U97]|uniref:class II fructose-1,6-bisphosphate aldolase n=1 Tax=Mycoplasma tauri TaxID=547987 RepID=UPI001CBD93D3|nr:class II fructose-1,6-bisphosphate aldolase [Mycoplasma tauri]MBZ4212862.1 class II fructose-1,6-bisphosphate aldolase [Mycoplasma tauri]
MIQKYELVNMDQMLFDARAKKYAIPHININNLEWLKNTLIAANDEKSPLIIGASMGAIKYMGGYLTVVNMTKSIIKDLKIEIPVALHLDHGDYEACLKAIESGFTSVMFDGSMLPFEDNLVKTKKIVALAKEKNISVEAEVGAVGGEEDGIVSDGVRSNPADAIKLANTGISALACGIGNIHGKYPESWKSLDFENLYEISKSVNIGIVLHGGSGIPAVQIQKAIDLGVSKINVNTELQLAFTQAVEDFVISGESKKGKNYDPRKLLKSACLAIQEVVKQKIKEFRSKNRARI